MDVGLPSIHNIFDNNFDLLCIQCTRTGLTYKIKEVSIVKTKFGVFKVYDTQKVLDISDNIHIPLNLREFQIQNWWVDISEDTADMSEPHQTSIKSITGTTSTTSTTAGIVREGVETLSMGL
uniref:Uncharacterized protein n=1 Tax=Rhipilia penicilloides TaxID=1979422 RepID=A0A2P0QHQ7_9CHLO|nr:hypothetical protein [Rhipilia penicilloides]ARO74297.1 hypothetical protein [Rhipilia penicilloides]